MAYYQDQLLPRIQNRIMDNKGMRSRRQRVCEGLRGDVIEIGFGSGLNVPYYPDEVSGVWAVDPSSKGYDLARGRLADATTPVHRAGLDGEELDLEDERFDAALSTWTLCTIPNVEQALVELHRVLKPGAVFHFVEHGHSPDPKVDRWQHRLEPTQKRFAGGCHLTRDIPSLVEAAGFTITRLETSYEKGAPKSMGYMFEATAQRPAVAGAQLATTSTAVSPRTAEMV